MPKATGLEVARAFYSVETRKYRVSQHVLANNLECFHSEAGMYDRPNLTTNTTSIRGSPDNKDTCPRCGGIVFHAERMLSKENVSTLKISPFQTYPNVRFLVFP